MLTQAVGSVEHQLCRVQRVDAVPRRCGRMRCLAVERVKIGRQTVKCAIDQVLVIKMDHHSHIVMVENTFFDHRALRAVGFLDRSTDHIDIRVQFVLQLRHRNAGQYTDGTADAVSAGMSDARKRVVFRHDRDFILMVISSVSCLEGGRQTRKRVFRIESLAL